MDPWLEISGLGSIALGSLALDLWLGIFGLGSLPWDLWLWILGFGSSAWDLAHGILGLGGNWDPEAGGTGLEGLGGTLRHGFACTVMKNPLGTLQ